VSSYALSLTSPVFQATFAGSPPPHIRKVSEDGAPNTIISLPDEDGDAMFVLCNILHLRNDKLPARVSPNVLRRLGALAQKYECVIAAGRATVQWFDALYFADDITNIWEIIEAAFLWDEATFFARFTSKWILQQSVFSKTIGMATSAETQKLAMIMSERLAMVSSIASTRGADRLLTLISIDANSDAR
jgi:hypothetical protein